MRILFGLEHSDAGEIQLDGRALKISSPAVAIKHGIGMVHQHFQLIPSMTVLENITLGAETGRGWLVDRRAALNRIQEIARRLGIDLPWQTPIADLSLGPQQRVEILKALYRQARLLIFDEPTAVLTAQEADHLFEVLRRLAAEGVTVIIITHKLHEVMALSRRITVMRRGKVAGVLETARTTPGEVAHLMLGEDVKPPRREARSAPGEVALETRD
jgi:simple sugar transport system ATP-binding protein